MTRPHQVTLSSISKYAGRSTSLLPLGLSFPLAPLAEEKRDFKELQLHKARVGRLSLELRDSGLLHGHYVIYPVLAVCPIVRLSARCWESEEFNGKLINKVRSSVPSAM